MDKIKSSKFAVFLDTHTTGNNSTWSRIGKGVTSMPISYGAKTTTETYVDEDNASTSVESYEIASDIEQTAIKGEPIFDYIDGIRKALKTGSDCETEALLVPVYDLTQSGNTLSGAAQKFGATIAITDLTVTGGEVMKIKYKLSFNGDPDTVNVTINSSGAVNVSNS